MKKSILVLTPALVVAGALASCNSKNYSRPEFSELVKSVAPYEKRIAEHRPASTTIKAHLDKTSIEGTLKEDGKTYINNESLTFDACDLASIDIDSSKVDSILNKFLSGKTQQGTATPGNATRPTSKDAINIAKNIFPYILKLPISTFVLAMIDGFQFNPLAGETITTYSDLIDYIEPLKWTKMSPSYCFEGNGDDKRITDVKIEIESLTSFIKEIHERFDDPLTYDITGDIKISANMSIDSNTGYISSVSLNASCENPLVIKDQDLDVNLKINGSAKITLEHTDAKTVPLKYQLMEYTPIFDETNLKYWFSKDKFTITKYDSLKDLEEKTGISTYWYKNIDVYDDPISKKDYYLTDSAEKSIGYEGFDYNVYFRDTNKDSSGQYSSKYNFLLNSPSSKSQYVEESEEGKLDNITKNNKTYSPDYTKINNLTNLSTVRYSSVDITGDYNTYSTAALNGKTAYFNYETIEIPDTDADAQLPTLHIFGTDLYNSKGTYTVSLGVFKLNQ